MPTFTYYVHIHVRTYIDSVDVTDSRPTITSTRTWPIGEFEGVLECLGAADRDDVGGVPPEGGDGTAAGFVQMKEVLVDAAMSTHLTEVTNPR